MERKREGRRKKISSHRDTVFLFENISEFIRDQENAMLPRLAQKKKKKTISERITHFCTLTHSLLASVTEQELSGWQGQCFLV